MTLSMMICSCDNNNYDTLYFIGDSLIANWDLKRSFPNTIVFNRGIGGSGITYLEGAAGTVDGKEVVVLSGTNDIAQAINAADWPDNYASRYMSAITGLGAEHVYIYSILPRGANFNGELFNPEIRRLNAALKEAATKTYGITFVDVYDKLCLRGILNVEYTCDGLHLNDQGYEILTSALNRQKP